MNFANGLCRVHAMHESPDAFSDALLRAIAQSGPDDIDFAQSPAPSHPELPDTRTSYKPIRIGLVDIPERVWVSYIHGDDGRSQYWYVVSWRCNRETGQEWAVDSEGDARRDVYEELRKWGTQ